MIYTCVNRPLPGLLHMFCLQQFSSIFESSVTALHDKRCQSFSYVDRLANEMRGIASRAHVYVYS